MGNVSWNTPFVAAEEGQCAHSLHSLGCGYGCVGSESQGVIDSDSQISQLRRWPHNAVGDDEVGCLPLREGRSGSAQLGASVAEGQKEHQQF
jgi:hypothetical protein